MRGPTGRSRPYAAAWTNSGIGALIVSTDGKHVQGIVSERDVIGLIARDGAEVLDRPVSDIMIRDVVTCSRSDNIAHLMETMTERRIRHLPVIDGDELVGIVSIGDVVKHRIQETEREATALRGVHQHRLSPHARNTRAPSTFTLLKDAPSATPEEDGRHATPDRIAPLARPTDRRGPWPGRLQHYR